MSDEESESPFIYDNVKCYGNESHWSDCNPSSAFGRVTQLHCQHELYDGQIGLYERKAGVFCLDMG